MMKRISNSGQIWGTTSWERKGLVLKRIEKWPIARVQQPLGDRA